MWAHEVEVPWDDADHDSGHAEFFVHVTSTFEPSPANWTPEEHVDVLAHRWWTLAELEATDESYEPRELVEVIRRNQL